MPGFMSIMIFPDTNPPNHVPVPNCGPNGRVEIPATESNFHVPDCELESGWGIVMVPLTKTVPEESLPV